MKPLLPTFLDFHAANGHVAQVAMHDRSSVLSYDIYPMKAAIQTAIHGPVHFHP